MGLVVSAAVAAAAPPIGAVTSVVLVRRAFERTGAFDGTGGVEPSEKARVLAMGISDAMNGAACGLIVSLVAVAAAIVFAVRLARARRAARG